MKTLGREQRGHVSFSLLFWKVSVWLKKRLNKNIYTRILCTNVIIFAVIMVILTSISGFADRKSVV